MFRTKLGWLAVSFLLLDCGGSNKEGPANVSNGQGDAGGGAGGGGAETAGRAGNGGIPRAAAVTLCTSTRGTVNVGDCCLTAPDFPDTCALGACGCRGTGSTHRVELCECPTGTCYDATAGCI